MREIAAATSRFRVLALSATPGTEPKKVQDVLDNLKIHRIEVHYITLHHNLKIHRVEVHYITLHHNLKIHRIEVHYITLHHNLKIHPGSRCVCVYTGAISSSLQLGVGTKRTKGRDRYVYGRSMERARMMTVVQW